MTLTINGEPRQFDDSVSVAALLTDMGLDPKKIAVERNREIVPRSQYDGTVLADGDKLEIVQFIGGGNAPAEPVGDKPLVIAGRTFRSRRSRTLTMSRRVASAFALSWRASGTLG